MLWSVPERLVYTQKHEFAGEMKEEIVDCSF